MYNEETTRLPTSEEDLWKLLRDQYDYAEMVLLDSAVQYEDEALDLIDTEESRAKKRLKAIGALIPFRGRVSRWTIGTTFWRWGASYRPMFAAP